MTKTARIWLIEERKRRRWSQQELADQLGTTRNTVGRWELGSSTPGPYFRTKLCTLFGKSQEELAWLLDQGEEQEQSSASPGEQTPSLSEPKWPIFWSVPYPRNPFFTGREASLASLQRLLERPGQATALSQSYALHGLGGIGKTQLALEYVYRFASAYQGVLWIRAETQEALLADVLSLADLLQLPQHEGHDPRQVMEAIKRWFISHEGWLLILDNADDLSVVVDFLPSSWAGHLLLTTRAQALGTLAHKMEIESMGMAESTLFLLRRARLIVPDASLDQATEPDLSAAEALAIELDFLPLALDQAGAYIEETGCSLSDYLSLYQTHHQHLLQRRGHAPTEHPESVTTTFSLNFERVEQASGAAAELLRLCVFLEADAIAEELIVQGGAALSPLLAHVTLDPFLFDEAIEQLRKFSLIQRNPEGKLLRVHRLVQAVLRERMEPQEQGCWAKRAVQATALVFPKTVEAATWAQCMRYLPQAQRCCTLIEHYALASGDAISLLSRTASYLYAVALYEQAEAVIEQVQSIYDQQVLRSDHPDRLASLDDLAIIYTAQGKYSQAEQLYRQALSIREQSLGLDHLDVARSLGSLARHLSRQGRYREAEPLAQRALRIREQVLGSEHLDVANSLFGLATLYTSQGKYEPAEALHKRALRIREQILGADHPNVGTVLNNLAELYAEQGKYSEAEPLYQRVLGIWEQAEGPNHPDVAYPLHGLAELYAAQGNYSQAEPLYQRCLRIFEQTLGPQHPLVAYPLQGLAKVACAQGAYEQAESLLQHALSIYEQVMGQQAPEKAEALSDLARVREAQGNLSEAASLYQQALVIRDEVYGLNHPKTNETRQRLQSVRAALDQAAYPDARQQRLVKNEQDPSS